MNRIKLFVIYLTIGGLLYVNPAEAQKLPFGKKGDDTAEPTNDDSSDEEGDFGGKMKAKMKNFNPMKTIGKLAGNLLTSSTDDLSTVSMQVFYTSNLYPSETRTVETEYFGFWEPGMDMAGVAFYKREGIGFNKIDGTVKIDGILTEHVANGFYGGIVKQSAGNHTVEVSTVKGDQASLTAEPVEPIEIISINGVPRGEVVDINMDEDIVLVLNHPQGGTADFYVSILGEVMGVRGFNELGLFKSVDKITIPKEAFRHTGSPVFKFEQGANYLMVQRTTEKITNVPGVGATQVISGAMDWSPINLAGDQKTFLGIGRDELNASYKVKTKDDFVAESSKPNAFWGPPLSEPKKLAMASFVVRATELKQEQTTVKTSSSTSGNIKTTTTTTTTKTSQFPEVPEIYWDQLVNEFYAKFEAALKSQLNVEIVPIETTMKAEMYKNLYATPDTVTKEIVVKPYKGCKLLLPTSTSEMWQTRGTTFPNDKPQIKLLKELDVDGIISVTVDCSMDFETGALSPRFAFKIDGPTNGWKVGPTTYATGLIVGPGQGVSESAQSAKGITDQLNKIMNVDRQIELFKEVMAGLKADELAKGYEKIWDLK
jgi:hypothetical protein